MAREISHWGRATTEGACPRPSPSPSTARPRGRVVSALTHCVDLSESWNLSEPPSLHLQTRSDSWVSEMIGE